MRLSRNRGAAETIHLTDQSFDETLTGTPGLVMVDFWAEWCGPCRAIAPVLEELATAAEGRVTLMKVNVDENHGLAARYAIQSIPTIVFFQEGAVVDRVVGAAPKAVLQDIVNASLKQRSAWPSRSRDAWPPLNRA
jgi:thioredoxin 1